MKRSKPFIEEDFEYEAKKDRMYIDIEEELIEEKITKVINAGEANGRSDIRTEVKRGNIMEIKSYNLPF